jgi:hypothetical protein
MQGLHDIPLEAFRNMCGTVASPEDAVLKGFITDPATVIFPQVSITNFDSITEYLAPLSGALSSRKGRQVTDLRI